MPAAFDFLSVMVIDNSDRGCGRPAAFPSPPGEVPRGDTGFIIPTTLIPTSPRRRSIDLWINESEKIENKGDKNDKNEKMKLTEVAKGNLPNEN